MITTKDKYHVAINDIGFVLQGSPENPAYVSNPAELFNLRYAQGDRTYDDFSAYWFWAQTDWFQGMKDSVEWQDDGKFYFSTNIDTYSEIGSIKLAKNAVLNNTFDEDIVCGCSGEVNGTVYEFVGTEQASNSRPTVYQWNGSTWTNIAGTSLGTNQNDVSQVLTRNSKLWVFTIGIGASWHTSQWDGTTWTDLSAQINTATGYNVQSARCACVVGSKIYVFVNDAANSKWDIVSTALTTPTVAGDWTVEVAHTTTDGLPIDACEYGGNLYYLISIGSALELRMYDITGTVETIIRTFKNVSVETSGVGGRYLLNHNGNLIITVPLKEIWSYNGASLTRIWYKDTNKTNYGKEAIGYLKFGAVISDNKIFWGNLVYDGDNFHNWIKPASDSLSNELYPILVDDSDVIFCTDRQDDAKIYKISTTVYKSGSGLNFLILNNFNKVSSIDKILYSVTLLFNALASGQSITVEYYTGEIDGDTTWTVLGSASYTSDGAVSEKVLFFPINTTFKKLWMRIKLDGGGSNSPTLKDIVTAYLPVPNVDKQWRLNLDCGNKLELLNTSIEARSGREIKTKLDVAWRKNQIIDFQDVDYFDTTISGGTLSSSNTTITVASTADAPESGRLRIEDEIIYYDGKTSTTFTNCTRGRKGTKAVSHANATTVHNGYKVLINSFSAQMAKVDENKNIEYIASISLREVI